MTLLRIEFEAMSSPCKIVIESDSASDIESAALSAKEEILRIERKYSRYEASSLISMINQRAGTTEFIEVDKETAYLLTFCEKVYYISEGLLDITSGVLRQVWDFSSGQLPEPGEIDSLLPLIGWDKVNWNGENICLTKSGMEIDFGSIGKEFAADKAAEQILERGFRHGFVNVGGDIRVIGPPLSSESWSFGIQHPRSPKSVIGSINMLRGALATSGDYERYMEVGGLRYCHVLNPVKGWPVSHWQSISVVAPTALAAGTLSTLGLLLEDRALGLLDREAEAYLGVRHDSEIFCRHASGQPLDSIGPRTFSCTESSSDLREN